MRLFGPFIFIWCYNIAKDKTRWTSHHPAQLGIRYPQGRIYKVRSLLKKICCCCSFRALSNHYLFVKCQLSLLIWELSLRLTREWIENCSLSDSVVVYGCFSQMKRLRPVKVMVFYWHLRFVLSAIKGYTFITSFMIFTSIQDYLTIL